MVPIIQKEIDMWCGIAIRIRAQKNTNLPDGIPNHIYHFPNQYGLEECVMSPTVHMHHLTNILGKKEDGCNQ